MIVVHIESGLGNQMLSYCEYLALKKENPDEDIYIDTIIYDIPVCNEIICQWQGYELENIFGLQVPNIKQKLSNTQWATLLSEINGSQFWLHNWNWPVYFQKAFKSIGIELKNMIGDFEGEGQPAKTLNGNRKKSIKDIFRHLDLYIYLQYIKNKFYYRRMAKTLSNEEKHFYKSHDNELTGQRLTFKLVNSGIERIEKEIRESFVFPKINDDRNKNELRSILSCNSVAIHARRGDMMGRNYPLYRFGYFKKCVNYIKSKVENPVFYIFCDPGSVLWARNNTDIFGLNIKTDTIRFVDWNKGEDSFRDMQLMAACKHQIITRSSFGWWASWLNTNPDKITCSPDSIINTTHHF